MALTFNEATKALLDGNNFPVVATIDQDGSAQTSVLWAKRDGDNPGLREASAPEPGSPQGGEPDATTRRRNARFSG